MSSISEQERPRPQRLSKKRFIFWEGGVKFGGVMALVTAGIEVLILNPEDYYPLTSVSPYKLLWMLVAHPCIWFGAGCLYGLVVWTMYGRRSQVERDG